MRSAHGTRCLALIVAGSAFAAAQAQPPAPAFEVASIKPHTGEIPRGGGHLTTSGTRLTVEVYSVMGLIMYAYRVKPYEIVNSESLDHTMYDIVANVGGDRVPTDDEFRAMMRNLLAVRFHLQTHKETKDIPVYAMVADKGGVKLTASAPGAEPKRATTLQGRSYRMKWTAITMDDLADYLRSNAGLDRPVVNLTGIAGTFDIELTYTPESRMAGAAADGSDVIPAAVALREQLGLRLEKRNAPHEFLVVDRLEKPTEN